MSERVVEMGNGRIELIIGPMFSGKTTEMTKRVKKFTFGNNPKNTIILKWDKDVRNGEKNDVVKTHDEIEIPCVRIPKELMEKTKHEDGNLKIPKKLFNIVKDCDVIGIDEGHFFLGLVKFCRFMAEDHNKIVIVAALDNTFWRKPFKQIIDLVAESEVVTKETAVCVNCSEDNACFTHKTKDSNKIIEVGGAEMYVPLCRKCFLKFSNY